MTRKDLVEWTCLPASSTSDEQEKGQPLIGCGQPNHHNYEIARLPLEQHEFHQFSRRLNAIVASFDQIKHFTKAEDRRK